MNEHPLLMKKPLVRATLEGRKTQTRRPINPQPSDNIENVKYDDVADLWLGSNKEDNALGYCFSWTARSPLGRSGDRLWVRETWAQVDKSIAPPDMQTGLLYQASWRYGDCKPSWKPSIHMPRWACRLVLPLVSVRVERAQDITEEDAIAEGVPHNSDRPIDKSWCAACCGHGIVERFALGMVSVDDCSECDSAKKLFRNGWISIYGQESWDANPWVWVAQWERIEVSR